MNQPAEQISLSDLVGKKLKGQYLLLEKIGQGGMGAVFSSVNESLGKAFAVKVLALQAGNVMNRPEAEARFDREVKLASKMSQSNIAQVFDCGVEYGYPYMVMEFVEGTNLNEMIAKEKPIKPMRALEIMRQLALALEEAERCGVVHRDIKPENIKLQRYRPGGPISLKVLDFGLAKSIKDEQDQLTSPGTVMGTVSYMAPEQISPEASSLRRSALGKSGDAQTQPARPLNHPAIDNRADLYSSGVILYYMVAGRLPFSGEMSAVLAAHLFQEPPPLPPEVPPQLAEITYKLLQKEPADRFQSATTLLDALQAAGESISLSASPVVPPAPPHPAPAPVLRPAVVVGALLLGAAVLGAVIWTAAPGRRGTRPDLASQTAELDLKSAVPSDLLLELPAAPDLTPALAPPDLGPAKLKKKPPDSGTGRLHKPVSALGAGVRTVPQTPAGARNKACELDEVGSCIIIHSSELKH